MSDPDWRATMYVLTKVMPPAMFTDKNLQCLVLGRMANLSFRVLRYSPATLRARPQKL